MEPATVKKIRHDFPKHGISLEQTDAGIIVSQKGNWYLARGWCLNENLIELMTEFLDSGFNCLIRTRHPQSSNRATGVDYIGFSSSETEPWLAVFDQYSDQKPITRMTVNSRFRDLLVTAGIPFSWETAGGKNMFVAVADIDQLLRYVTPIVTRSLNKRGGNQRSDSTRAALTTEAELQSLLIENTQKGVFSDVFGTIESVIVNPRWQNNADGLDPQMWDIPDVLVGTDSALWVLELKLHEIGVQAVHQVSRYVSNPACHALANGRRVRPVVIGFYRSPELALARVHVVRDLEVCLWTYSWSAERGLELCCQ